MTVPDYTTSNTVPTITPTKRKRKRLKTALSFPALDHPDKGVHVLNQLTGTRYKVWYYEGDRKQYVILPKGISLDEARTRRDTLYRNLKEKYGARRRPARLQPAERKPYKVKVTPDRYIYRQKPWIVVIRGKQVAEANTKQEAASLRDQWLRDNAEKTPNLVIP